VAVAAFALVAIVGNYTAIKLAVQYHRRLREAHPVGGHGVAAQIPTVEPAEPASVLATAEVAGGRIEEGSRAEG
jgi:hypothetical protein